MTKRYLFPIVIAALGLTACTPRYSATRHFYSPDVHKDVAEDIAAHQTALLNKLRGEGVQVVQKGQIVRLILPSDSFFEPQSTKIKFSRLSTLSTISELIHHDKNAHIRIVGYTDNVGTGKEKHSISMQQAQNVAAFFWSQGLKVDRVSVHGKGDTPIATNKNPDGSAMNRRVEIIL